MITIKQRNKLKELLKGNYTKAVKEKLDQLEVTNRYGNPYSDKMISHVFNGRYKNVFIEKAIFEVYADRKKAIKKDLEEKNKALGIILNSNDI